MTCRLCNVYLSTEDTIYMAILPHEPPWTHSVLCGGCHDELQEDHSGRITSTPVKLAITKREP